MSAALMSATRRTGLLAKPPAPSKFAASAPLSSALSKGARTAGKKRSLRAQK